MLCIADKCTLRQEDTTTKIHPSVVKFIIFKLWQFSAMYREYNMPPLPNQIEITG